MKLSPVFSLLFFLLVISGCRRDDSPEKAKQILEEIKTKYAPDKRVALFKADSVYQGNSLVVKGETNLPDAKAEMLEKFKSSGIVFTDSFQLLPSPTLQGKNFGVVSVSVCNIRSEPRHSAELSTQAVLGTLLRVWKKKNGFFLVQTPEDYLGWLDPGGFALFDSLQYGEWMKDERAVCIEDYIFAYEEPDAGSQKVSDLLAGNILRTSGFSGGFTEVAFPDGRKGFVHSDKLLNYEDWLASRQPDAGHILATAREMMGRPYLWGGASGKGMDCSGYTKTVFYLNGVLLPRDANQQAMVGTEIATDTTLQNLLPGDLLFFGRKATDKEKEKISHVAIYLGNGKIIHASNKVETASLRRGDADFAVERLNTFLRSKRVIGSVGKNGVTALSDSPFYGVEKKLEN